MAERPRRKICKPLRFEQEQCSSLAKRAKKQKKDNKYYEVEVKDVDREKHLVRIHYKAYSEKYDEWRSYGCDNTDGHPYFPFIRQENMPEPLADSLDERVELFVKKLYREIKRKLYSSRQDDPSVRIEVDASEDVFI